MAISIQCVSVDAIDPAAQARWRAEARSAGGSRTRTRPEYVVEPPADSPEEGVSPDLLFVAVPEHKELENRLPLDLRPDDQEAELARFEALGARRVDVGQADDVSWVVLADPGGNEFCILRALTPDER